MKMMSGAVGGMVLALALGIAAGSTSAQTREAAPTSDAAAAVSNKAAPAPAPEAKGNWTPGQSTQQGSGGSNSGQSRPPANNSNNGYYPPPQSRPPVNQPNGGYNPGQNPPGRYPDFRSLIGMHGDAATQRMRDWGYRWAKTDGQGADTVKYFYSERDGGCAALQVRSDRVRDAMPTDAGRCRQNKPTPGPSDPNWGKPLPREITGLVGNKRSDAEDKLAGLGFAKVDAQKTQGKTFGLWYNRYRYDCIEVEANDGRIRRIDRARRSACE